MTPCIFRQLQPSDAEALLSLRVETMRDFGGPFGSPEDHAKADRLDVAQEAISLPDSVTFGAWDGALLIGAASIALLNTYGFGTCFGLGGVAVRIAYQGEKVGRALVSRCVSFAKHQQAEDIILDINLPNLRAQELYESFGFEVMPQAGEQQVTYQHDNVTYVQWQMRLKLDTP